MNTDLEAPGFIIYKDTFAPLIQFLSPSELGKLVTAMYTYCDTGAEPAAKGRLAFAWGTVKPRMDRDMERYMTKVETSKYAAYCREQKKAGLTPLSREAWITAQDRVISSDIVRYPNKDTDINTDTDTDSNSNSNTEKEIPAAGTHAPSAEPDEEEVRRYCEEKGYSLVNEEKFVSHYRTRNWMVGDTPMRDWRAMVDAWEQKARDRSPRASAPQSPARALAQLERLERLRREMTREAAGEDSA